MATRKKYKMTVKERMSRNFSEEFKKQKVREIEQKISTASEVSRQYEVSLTSISRWLRKYSINYSSGVKTIVETESDTRKLIDLQARIAELERLVGQKQIQLDFKDKMIDLAEECYGVDIKKKFEKKPLSGFGSDENS